MGGQRCPFDVGRTVDRAFLACAVITSARKRHRAIRRQGRNQVADVVVDGRRETRTITTGLAEFVTVTGTNWGQMAATATLTLVPALVFLGLVQQHIVAGLTFGAVKE